MPSVNTKNKKELKKYINENGFFLHVDSIEEVKEDSIEDLVNSLEDAHRTSAVLPSGENSNIQVFRGLASQKYGKGKKNRNGYKYDIAGFDLKNYKKNPLILLQHNRDMPIGKCLSLSITEEGLEIVYYVDFNSKAGKEYEHDLKSGLIGMLSTGAITNDWGVEEVKTGKVFSRKEAKEKGIDLWEVLFGNSEEYILVITKSELIENSQVTIGSNEEANARPDSLFRYFENEIQAIQPKINEIEEEEEGGGEEEGGEEKDTAKNNSEEEKEGTPETEASRNLKALKKMPKMLLKTFLLRKTFWL
jgi:hypothetical protein